MRASGFTLIELMVVLTLMSIVMAVTAPRLAGRRQAAALRGVGDDVVSMSSAARARAVMGGRPVGLLLDRGGTLLRLVMARMDKKQRSYTDLLPPRELTSGYRVAIRRAERQAARADGNVLYFRPDGSAPASELQVLAPTGEALLYRLIEPLGQWRLSAAAP